MDFDKYQAAARKTAKLDIGTTTGRMELLFGLMSAVGSLARAFKLFLRDAVGLEAQKDRLMSDIGDVQWYLAMIAGSLDIRLGEVAKDNLRRTNDRYAPNGSEVVFSSAFDEGYLAAERFPRRLLFRIAPAAARDGDATPHVSFFVMDAQPYVFEDRAPPLDDARPVGFKRGQEIGDAVNDNALGDDGYRYHDAVHVAFMAVLGWSPVMRQLLRVKRKSDAEVDRAEDGARARDLEEALSAILKAFSVERNGFATEADVDGEVRDIIQRVVTGLEVRVVPIWLWARAITQGYAAMHALHRNGGGWLVADLGRQTVLFSAERPDF